MSSSLSGSNLPRVKELEEKDGEEYGKSFCFNLILKNYGKILQPLVAIILKIGRLFAVSRDLLSLLAAAEP
jgi:hypothetical protein